MAETTKSKSSGQASKPANSKPASDDKQGGKPSQSENLIEGLAQREAELANANQGVNKSSDDTADLRARLAQLEAERDQLAGEVETLKSQPAGGGMALNPSARVEVGNGYKFIVQPRREIIGVEPKEILACDESEAVRWYCQVTENPKRPGRAIDPSVVDIIAKIAPDADARRERALRKDKRISRLRQRLNMGHDLSQDEMDELQEAEDQRQFA